MRGRLQIDLGLDRHRVRKCNIAPLQAEFDAVEGSVAFQNVGAPEHAGTRQRAPQAQVGIPREPRDRGLHLKLRSSTHRDIELHVVKGRTG